jgi:hypothetical protein
MWRVICSNVYDIRSYKSLFCCSCSHSETRTNNSLSHHVVLFHMTRDWMMPAPSSNVFTSGNYWHSCRSHFTVDENDRVDIIHWLSEIRNYELDVEKNKFCRCLYITNSFEPYLSNSNNDNPGVTQNAVLWSASFYRFSSVYKEGTNEQNEAGQRRNK